MRPDPSVLRAELVVLKKRMLYGAIGFAVMAALNLLLFQGAGAIVVGAPLALIVHSALRHRAVSAHLARSSRSLGCPES